jgi:dTDP-4-dehydrorhamnose reductase
VIAEEALENNALLIHYSTDYVFDGTKTGPYTEADEPNPVNAYGRTKLAGEHAITSSGCDFLILRTSWVYTSRGNNFLLTILRLAGERNELSIVADQTGSPTSARSIADATALCIHQAHNRRRSGDFSSGLYHLTSSNCTSWHGFSEAIITIANRMPDTELKVKTIKRIPSAEYPTPATRPVNSCLETARIEKSYNIRLPDWRLSLGLCMDELSG